MINLNQGGEGLNASFTPAPFALSLHPKFPSNPLSIYFYLLGEGVKGGNREIKTFAKDVLFILRKFEILILHHFLHLHPFTSVLSAQNKVLGHHDIKESI